jgi:signal transduction histidine kinase/ActR/RegA family two-component response regulator
VASFRDLPIRRQLLLMSVASSAAALVLAGSGFLVWDIIRFRSDLQRDMTAAVSLLAENSGAPLTFRDDRVASEILGVLRYQPRIVMACLYDRGGAPFSAYQRAGGAECPVPPATASRMGWDTLEFVGPVTVNQKQVGSITVRRELTDLYARLRVAAATALALLLVATVGGILMTFRLQRSIAVPLLTLASTARQISTTRDYSLRARTAGNQEIGAVVVAFNEMLDRMKEALDREREANHLKDEFLATLSHELRTPLNAIMGWTRMLRSGRLDQTTQAKALQTIERNAKAQVTLIEDLLDMSGIVNGQPRLRARTTDLATIVDAAVDVVKPAALAKQIAISVTVGVRPALTHGDPGRLQQIVWNLLSNAVKFTPPGGTIRVRLTRENGYLLSVQDTGQGIDPAFQPFVFDPFRQADGTTTREVGGLGLGLAIVKQLVELHGGTIWMRSEGPGRGSTFEVALPSVIEERRGEAAKEDVRPPMMVDPDLLEGLDVLVVDDDEDARVLLSATLSQYGARVTTASSVKDALESVDRQPPAIILSDIGMPHEDGLALIRQLRARPPERGGTVPAVAVSAYAAAGDGRAAAAAGYQAHVAKPFEPSEIVELVAVLGRSQPEVRAVTRDV